MKRIPIPPVPYDNSKSKWRLHFEKTARDNPHLTNNRDRHKKACETWIMAAQLRLK